MARRSSHRPHHDAGDTMTPTVRFHISSGDEAPPFAIGPGKIALLEAIERTGSITGAAKALGMSYRRAWLLVEETNRCLRAPAVVTAAGGKSGGGTLLTPAGRRLCERYRAIERDVKAAVERDLSALLAAKGRTPR